MGFSLKGFATGLATAASEVMDEERKQTNNLIAQRTKNSFENYTKYQENTEALRADIKKKDTMLLNWQPDLTEQERIAAAGIPNLVDMYQRLVADGKQVSVRDMIKVSEKSVGMKFDNYVTELGKIAPAQGLAPVTEAKFLGPSEESQRKAAEKYAATTGVPEAELRAFQAMPRTADVSSMGSLNVDVFKRAPKEATSVQEFAEMARLQRLKAEAEKGVDSPEYKEANAAFNLAVKNLDKPNEVISARKDRLIQEKIDPKTSPVRIKEINGELNKLATELKNFAKLSQANTPEEKKVAYTGLTRSVGDYVNIRMREMKGASWYKNTTFQTLPLPDGGVYVDRSEKVELTPEQQADQSKVVRQLTKEALASNGYITQTGAPLSPIIREYMNNMGVLPDQKLPSPDGAAPVAPQGMQPPPKAAIDLLKANPSAAADFDKKYPGFPAKSYLGK